MSKKRKEWSIFIWVAVLLFMTGFGLVVAGVITFFALLAADFIYYDVPSYVPTKMVRSFRRREFWQCVNWIFAGVVFGIVFIGCWVGVFGGELRKWLRKKEVIQTFSSYFLKQRLMQIFADY